MRKTAGWALFVVLALASAFFGLAFALGIFAGVSGNAQKGSSRSGTIIGAVILLALAVALALLARATEHHLRTHHGPGFGGSPAADAGRPETVIARWSRRRPHTPHSFLAELVTLAVMIVIFAVIAIAGFVSWDRSNKTQHHGLAANGVVTRVIPVRHSSRYGSSYTYNIDVGLSQAVGGRNATRVHTPDRDAPASVGDTVAILIDRSDPSYAELPGRPANSIDQGLVGIGLLVFIGLVILWSALGERKARATARSGP